MEEKRRQQMRLELERIYASGEQRRDASGNEEETETR